MGAFPGQDLRSEVFPDFNWKFVKRGKRRNKGDTGRAGNSVIKLLPSALVWKISDPIRKAGRAFNQAGRF
jgi:hypothetical protein